MNKHTFKADAVSKKMSVDKNEIVSTNSFNQNVDFYNFALFACALPDAPIRYYCCTKLYSAKFWYGDNLVRDFVPVVRKSDNVGGLWDKVGKKFYTSKTTTPFIVP